MTTAIALSIIIVNWNTRDLLAQCLESVGSEQQVVGSEQSTAGCPPPSEVIVVDNASSDGSAAMVCERFPWVNLIESQRNLGFAAGNNLAMRQAKGESFLLLNPDTIVQPGAVINLLKPVQINPRVGIVGAQLLNSDGSQQMSWGVFPSLSTELPLLSRFGRRRHLQRAVEQADRALATTSVDWVSGACLLIRRHVTEEIGLLDEDYWLYTEETDWCYRASQAGWEIALAPAARVYHLARAASRQRFVPAMLHFYQSRVRFVQKHHGDAQANGVRRIYGLKARVWQARPHRSPSATAYPELPAATIGVAYRQLQQAMSQQLALLLAAKW